jgi:hypothetical protein
MHSFALMNWMMRAAEKIAQEEQKNIVIGHLPT